MNKNFAALFAAVFFFAGVSPAQTDWVKWEKVEFTYAMELEQKPETKTGNAGFSDMLISSLRKIYKFFISDLDGDNCPFTPTCSAFFVDAVKETNLIQGALMFADRFTRDMNLIDRNTQYPAIKNRLYDPAFNYTLKKDKIYLTPSGL